MYRNWIVLIVAVILIGAAFAQSAKSERKEATLQGAIAGLEGAVSGEDVSSEVAAKKGLSAPAFQLSSLEGKTFQAGGKRDKPLLINFWASWCGPCKAEAPDLVSLYEKYKDQIDVYAVNITQGDSIDNAKAFAEKYGYSFPVLLDESGAAAELYHIRVIPTSFLIDRNGIVREVFHVLSPDDLERTVRAGIDSQ